MTDRECNATLPTAPQFRSEGVELQAIVNKTAGATPSVELSRMMLVRTRRLSALAERQAQHEAEKGDFAAAREWDAKAAKLAAGLERQARQLRQRLEQAKAAGGGEVADGKGEASAEAKDGAEGEFNIDIAAEERVPPPPAETMRGGKGGRPSSVAEMGRRGEGGLRQPQVLSAFLLQEAMVSPFGIAEEDEADFLARSAA